MNWSIVKICLFCALDCGQIFQTKLFPGSRRLFELADSITENIKNQSVTAAARRPRMPGSVRTRYVITEGDQVFLGGNDRYIAMCHQYAIQDYINEHQKGGTSTMELNEILK